MNALISILDNGLFRTQRKVIFPRNKLDEPTCFWHLMWRTTAATPCNAPLPAYKIWLHHLSMNSCFWQAAWKLQWAICPILSGENWNVSIILHPWGITLQINWQLWPSRTWYKSQLEELLGCLRSLSGEWQEYLWMRERISESVAYHVSIEHSSGRGRPRFVISQDQLEHLHSLSFS